MFLAKICFCVDESCFCCDKQASWRCFLFHGDDKRLCALVQARNREGRLICIFARQAAEWKTESANFETPDRRATKMKSSKKCGLMFVNKTR